MPLKLFLDIVLSSSVEITPALRGRLVNKAISFRGGSTQILTKPTHLKSVYMHPNSAHMKIHPNPTMATSLFPPLKIQDFPQIQGGRHFLTKIKIKHLHNYTWWIYSAHTRAMNVMALFSLYFHFICTFFTYFVVIFYIFPELTNYICEPKQWHKTFFLLFSVFLSFHATRLRRLSVCGYTCIPNKEVAFLAVINLRSLKSDLGFQFTAKWHSLQQIKLVSTTFIKTDAFLDTFVVLGNEKITFNYLSWYN